MCYPLSDCLTTVLYKLSINCQQQTVGLLWHYCRTTVRQLSDYCQTTVRLSYCRTIGRQSGRLSDMSDTVGLSDLVSDTVGRCRTYCRTVGRCASVLTEESLSDSVGQLSDSVRLSDCRTTVRLLSETTVGLSDQGSGIRVPDEIASAQGRPGPPWHVSVAI